MVEDEIDKAKLVDDGDCAKPLNAVGGGVSMDVSRRWSMSEVSGIIESVCILKTW